MGIQEVIDYLPPREDLVRIARYVGSLQRPARTELVMCGVASALIGAGLALLFAPTRGSELRSQFRSRLEDLWRAAQEAGAADGHDRSAAEEL